ncbi:MAG: glutamate 5-kinase [Eubacteriaceae bacterium]|jgi:glutamate 5-kinase
MNMNTEPATGFLRFNGLTEQDLPVAEREGLRDASRIVVKMGTSSLTHPNGRLNLKKIDQLARIMTDLENAGKRMVLVSSGAIGCGMTRLGMRERPTALKDKQAAASVGQGLLMEIYQKSFSDFHQNIAQILLTKDVFSNTIKSSNARDTFDTLFELGIIPIVNENDSISTDEILEECFGDNDILSAMTAEMVGADALLILSDVDGLYDSNPMENEEARLIPSVIKITPDIMRSAGSSATRFGTGGMSTKIGAAHYATRRGINTVIASGEDVRNVYRILDGCNVGTIFFRNQDSGKQESGNNSDGTVKEN